MFLFLVFTVAVNDSVPTGNVSTYPRWRRRFAGMIISPTDLQYGNMIGEGMLIMHCITLSSLFSIFELLIALYVLSVYENHPSACLDTCTYVNHARLMASLGGAVVV